MLQDQQRRSFYRMKIISADGQHNVELPEHVLRLIADVTISESSYNDTQDVAPSLSFVMQETMYLPDTQHLIPQNGVQGSGSITNRTGSILDLRFDGEKGFTFVSKAEMESGLTKSKRTTTAKAAPVIFLFHGNNKIEIEWGLLQPFKRSRKRVFTLSTISVAGGSSGHGTVSITALDGSLNATKTKLDRGVVYKDQKTGDPDTLKQVMWKVAKTLDCDLEFDGARVTTLPTSTKKFVGVRTQTGGDTAVPDPSAPITQPKQASMHDFVKDMANDYSSSYEFFTDPITNREVLRFAYREVRFAKVDRVFTYRSPSGDVLNYKVDSVEGTYNPIAGASSTIDGGEKSTITVSQQLVTDDTTTKTADKIVTPANPKDQKRVKDNLNRNYVEIDETTPAKTADAIANHSDTLYSKAKYNSTLALTTIGDPDYKPGMILMNGIGLRYSKKYRMFTVQHKLGNSGYTCSWSGMSHYDGEGGVNPADASKENKTLADAQLVDNTR